MGGDLARDVEGRFVRALTQDDLLVAEAVPAKTALSRERLAGPASGPLEALLAERVVLCWLQVHDAEVRYRHWHEHGKPTPQTSDFQQRRIDRAQKRYLAALKTLAVVRRLALPLLVAVPVPTRPAPRTVDARDP